MAKITLNHAGVRDLLRSDDVRRDLEDRARRIAEAAGDGFAYSATVGHSRALAMVWADTPQAVAAEARDHVLITAIDQGR